MGLNWFILGGERCGLAASVVAQGALLAGKLQLFCNSLARVRRPLQQQQSTDSFGVAVVVVGGGGHLRVLIEWTRVASSLS